MYPNMVSHQGTGLFSMDSLNLLLISSAPGRSRHRYREREFSSSSRAISVPISYILLESVYSRPVSSLTVTRTRERIAKISAFPSS